MMNEDRSNTALPTPHSQIFLGTVGYAYQPWVGVFYPAGLSSRSYLTHYSQFFNSVEIDSTFYGTPGREKVQTWAQAVPAGFTFCPKTPRQITHEQRLSNPAAMQQFIDTMREFGEKLGVILIQLPPDFTAAEQDALRRFLGQLPTSDLKFAVEFRHLSWVNEQTAGWLREAGVGWVAADYTILPRQIVPTCDFLYLRFLGEHGRYETKDHERRDPTADLHHWVSLLQKIPPFKQIFGYFNNDYAGYSPISCNRFKTMLGLPAVHPQLPRQASLF